MPRVVWFCWLQGMAGAPYIVRRCHESWARRNPAWLVEVIDRERAEELSGLDLTSGRLAGLSKNHQSDLLRLALLSRRGGVWVDSTCYCTQPLDAWLPPLLGSGFFAFANPGNDRVLASWFLASEPQHLLTSRLYELLLDHWGNHRFHHNGRHDLLRRLARTFNTSPDRTLLWFLDEVRNGLAVTPYYALHYLFHQLTTFDPECRELWEATPKVSANGPHRIAARGPAADVGPLRAEIDARRMPLYKLNWRVREDSITPGSALGYLLAADEAPPAAGQPVGGLPHPLDSDGTHAADPIATRE